jgi:transcriptional regulator with XRE-family HTH domain
MHDTPIGQLVKLHRIERRMSIVSLATRAGITVRYLEMIEADTKIPTIHVLRKLADVLRVPTAALVSDTPSEDRDIPVGPRLAPVERALHAYGSLSTPDPDSSAPPDLVDLTARTRAARHAWYLSPRKYSEALDALPGLIVDAEHAVRAYDRSRVACRVASDVYRDARGVLKHAGRPDLGALVSDRAMRYAEETGDPVLIAAAAWNIGHAMLTSGMPEGALDRHADVRTARTAASGRHPGGVLNLR